MQSAGSEPLVFWRETGKGRRGLACHVQFCDDPGCACREAFVQAFEVDERFHSIVSRGESLELRHLGGHAAPPSRTASAVVDLESGRFLKNRGETHGEPELLEWLGDALDDEAMSRLRSSWSAFKLELKREEDALAGKKWKERDWTRWDGEEPVAWRDIVGEGAIDRYERKEGSYEARDCYCIRPGCECHSMTVRFFADSGDLLGEVFLDAATGEVTGTGNRPGGHRVLLDLFDRFESRNDLASFARRAERMTRIGPEIHALRRQQLRGPSGGKVGRNAPCPCGSGRKFKNCCGR